ncbi:hypothetical protein DFH09DRAFT_1468014, partial [Mycena vulgaris]
DQHSQGDDGRKCRWNEGRRGSRYGCCDGWERFPWAIAVPVGCRRATRRSGGHEDRTQACTVVRRWSAVLEPIRGRRERHWTHQMGRDIPIVLRQDGVVYGLLPTCRRQGYGSRRACAMASQVDIDFSYLAWVGNSSDGSLDAPDERDIRSVPTVHAGVVGILPNDGEDVKNADRTQDCAMVRRWSFYFFGSGSRGQKHQFGTMSMVSSTVARRREVLCARGNVEEVFRAVLPQYLDVVLA